MTDTDDPTLPVARDLTEITNLVADLAAEALARAGSPGMPGGDAMVMLAHDASLEAWEHRVETAETAHYTWCPRHDHRRCRVVEHVADHDPDWEPPLQTLLWWSEQLRT
ncbi:MAG: hypothetical protein ACRD0P_19590, partial [Stackebrandtia sp.]